MDLSGVEMDIFLDIRRGNSFRFRGDALWETPRRR